jgi:hypothetical protein
MILGKSTILLRVVFDSILKSLKKSLCTDVVDFYHYNRETTTFNH